MTYETLISLVERTKRVKLRDVTEVIEKLYNEIQADEDAIEFYYKIYDLFDCVLQLPILEGSESDFHNLTVVCARQDDYDIACQVLDIGLETFPFSIDLLADYLAYGTNCGRNKQCEAVYRRLLTQHEKWNWRAYHFSICYLMELGISDAAETVGPNQIYAMIKEFEEKLPTHEECYIDEAEFFHTFYGDSDKERGQKSYVSVLEYATSDECPVKRTPRCDLRLADYYYDEGKNLQKAVLLLERCKRNSIQTQLSVKRNYVYLLSSLCKMSQYYDLFGKEGKKKVLPEEKEKEKLILEIYENYHIAAIKSSDSRIQGCKNLIETFICETGVPYPYETDGIDIEL